MPDIKLTNLIKKFGDVTAVDNLNVTIPDGSFFTLLGPSGCGKTTTLRMIAGLEKPTAGKIEIGKQLVFDSVTWTVVPPGKRNVGLVFQSYALWPHMTVYDNISFPLRIQKLSRDQIQKKVDGVMNQVKITGLEKRYPSELSGGQQQRVAVARELVTGVEVLSMDEPLGNLDAQLRLEMRTELKRLHKATGQTILYVTHDQLEAMTMSTHVAVMKDGLLQQLSHPDDIYASPANTFIAEFIGSLPINLFNVEVMEGIAYNNDLKLKLELPGKFKSINGKAILGIRPENLSVVNNPTKTSVLGSVDSSLPAGSEVLIKVSVGEIGLNIKEKRGMNLEMDSTVHVDLDMEEACFFDSITGNNLLTVPGAQQATKKKATAQ